MKMRFPVLCIVVMASLLIGAMGGWYVGKTITRYRSDVSAINIAYVFLEQTKTGHAEKGIKAAETEVVWGLTRLRSYPFWARFGNRALMGNHLQDEEGQKVLRYIEPATIEKLASEIGLTEADVRKIAREHYGGTK